MPKTLRDLERRISEMPVERVRNALLAVVLALYPTVDDAEDSEIDVDAEWSPDTLDAIAEALQDWHVTKGIV